jgi:hypothetical protein
MLEEKRRDAVVEGEAVAAAITRQHMGLTTRRTILKAEVKACYTIVKESLAWARKHDRVWKLFEDEDSKDGGEQRCTTLAEEGRMWMRKARSGANTETAVGCAADEVSKPKHALSKLKCSRVWADDVEAKEAEDAARSEEWCQEPPMRPLRKKTARAHIDVATSLESKIKQELEQVQEQELE